VSTNQPEAKSTDENVTRPILFSAPMVRAILAGLKTQTRRVIKPQPKGEPRPLSEWSSSLAAACGDGSPDPKKLAAHSDRLKGRIFPFADAHGLYSPNCPYGRPGNHLWVRETWAWPGEEQIIYRADPEAEALVSRWRADPNYPQVKWCPSIHMRRQHSRIALRVTDVRVERLNDISQQDAIAEGMPAQTGPFVHHVIADYRRLWGEINGKESWDANPWVWVVEFERVVAQKAAA
jgi:hypothetical protein